MTSTSLGTSQSVSGAPPLPPVPTQYTSSTATRPSAIRAQTVRPPQEKLSDVKYTAFPGTPVKTTRLTSNEPIHVTGTPGTGKSAFALYLLWVIQNDYPNDAIMFRHGDVNPACYIYYRNKTFCHPSIHGVFNDSLLVRFLTQDYSRPIWTILDGAAAVPTGQPESNTIVLTSLGQQTIPLKHFVKYATTIVNPPWTMDEIEIVRNNIYPHLAQNAVADAYNKWGGIPRILLDWGDKPGKMANLESSIYTTDPTLLFRQVGLAKIDHANVSGIHFHLIPGQKVPDDLRDDRRTQFQYPAYWWASTWLQDRFWEELTNNEGELTIMKFLLDRNNEPAARAYAFEPHVFRTLANAGIKGRMKQFTDTGDIDFQQMALPPLVRRRISNFTDLPTGPNVHDNAFYVPTQTNHTSVDLYIPSMGLMVQITVGQKHGVKWKGIQAAMDSGIFQDWQNDHPGEKLSLVFLCDSYNYEGFIKQPFLNQNGKTYKRQTEISNMNALVDQFAWELDVEVQRKAHEDSQRKKRLGQKSAGPSRNISDGLKPPPPKEPPKKKGKGKSVDKGIADPSSRILMGASGVAGPSGWSGGGPSTRGMKRDRGQAGLGSDDSGDDRGGM